MQPTDFKDANVKLMATGCADLPALRKNGFFYSVWKPSQDEIDCLVGGGEVHVTIVGYSHPPIRLTAEARDTMPGLDDA